MKAIHIYALTVLVLVSISPDCFAETEYNIFGGWTHKVTENTGYFHAKEIDGVWWLIDPAGGAFVSKGVNHISFMADFSPKLGISPYALVTQEKYGMQKNWAEAVAKNLWQWNFNTVGSWSSSSIRVQKIPYTIILNIGQKAGGDWQSGAFPDVYAKDFARTARRIAREECRKRETDIYLLGYFTDNELRWAPDWRSKDSLLATFLKADRKTAGHQALIAFLKERYPSIEQLNVAWGTDAESYYVLHQHLPKEENEALKKETADFQQKTAEQYFRVCRESILKEDPNHLVLGCRFAGVAPKPVLKAVGKYVDVVSFNTYNYKPPKDALDYIHEVTEKPIMITEFSFKAMDSGLPNTRGAGKSVATQQDRADLFTSFISELMQFPYMVGYHWFEYCDEPAEGRFDGENSNYGLVNINDEPWEILTTEMTKTNAAVETLHSKQANQEITN